ncbi:hypothetical protein H8L32_19955 [Undibacterium sp. CY18W]|uniref:Uncharacterized protein n=1 Tax=Undibacterium hunanense TaxID=2762292 RepID=A0ABR6ZW65_9BURK|nr:hypothetical protein [Undibacterium hunanense]MBC3919755.1 hypothetical protein [Undibacterium hunanense]
MATNTRKNIFAVEQVRSSLETRSKSGQVSRVHSALAMAALALSISGAAVAVDKVNATQSTAAVISTQEIILKDGQKTTFVLIGKMPQAEQEATLAKMKRIDILQFRDWEIQNVENRIVDIDQTNIAKMEKILALGQKLTADNRKYLETIVASKKPPVDLLAANILKNPNNFK